MALTTADFEYDLPEELIAQEPARPRDASRLMVLRRDTGRRDHCAFSDLPDQLRAGDLLVVNDTRVVPARFTCRRASGGRIGGLFLREESPGRWEVMLKGAARCKVGEELTFEGAGGGRLVLAERRGEGVWAVQLPGGESAEELLGRIGKAPLPPYIRRPGPLADSDDRQAYQTIYAERPGAVAAPTAGLHFTPRVTEALAEKGVERTTVTLHVGLGTFAPVKAAELADHEMHSEWYELSADAAQAIQRAKDDGRRVIAVGTTSVRVLEAAAARWHGLPAKPCSRENTACTRLPLASGQEQAVPPAGPLQGRQGWTDLFLYPPAEFRLVDALLTNFHLPRSTLLMLVAAFCAPGQTDGRRLVLDAYADAVRQRYRFYSYGDAMLIL